MALEIKPNAMSQGDLAKAVAAIAHCLLDICTKLDADAGITDTDYNATADLYYTVRVAANAVKSLEKA